jgi:hypothetical protein
VYDRFQKSFVPFIIFVMVGTTLFFTLFRTQSAPDGLQNTIFLYRTLNPDPPIRIRIGGSGSGTGRRQFRIRFVLYWLRLFSSGNFLSVYISFSVLLFFSVCFETDLFALVVSKRVRNTETNRKNLLLVSRNKPKMNWNRLNFGLFRFEQKKKFVCF